MAQVNTEDLLTALLDSWARNNAMLLGFLRDLPDGGLEWCALESSWPIAVQLMHVHHTRQFYVAQAVPALGEGLPALYTQREGEWIASRDFEQIHDALQASAEAVSAAVQRGVTENLVFRGSEISYDHPVLLLQHMLWHEGYHVGQMMLARKAVGQPMSDGDAARLLWSHWQRAVEAQ